MDGNERGSFNQLISRSLQKAAEKTFCILSHSYDVTRITCSTLCRRSPWKQHFRRREVDEKSDHPGVPVLQVERTGLRRCLEEFVWFRETNGWVRSYSSC